MLVAGDFNGDKIDDILMIGRDVSGTCQTLYGKKSAPWFTAGPTWLFPQWASISDAPLYQGDCLYIPVNDRGQGVAQVQRFHLTDGAWRSLGHAAVYGSTSVATISSLKITRTSRDLDRDCRPDIVAVFGEDVSHCKSTFHAAYISVSGVHGQVKVPALGTQPGRMLVADVHASLSISTAGGAEEYIVVLSGAYQWGNTGIGILTLAANLGAGTALYGSGLPAARYGGQLPQFAASCYGRFGRSPNFGSTLIQLHPGEAMVMDPDVLAPYVASSGEILHSSMFARYLDEATADYDGDGLDEVVLAENYSSSSTTLVYIGDPTHKRKYAQVYNLADPNAASGRVEIHHGTRGDFNGDGSTDLALSYEDSSRGYLALFLADRSKGAGKPALSRVH